MGDKFNCFICDREPGAKPEDWDLESLRFIYGDGAREDFSCFKLCRTHLDFCKKRIPELEKILPKNYDDYNQKIIENPAQASFLPKQVEPGKNFTEREPGEDDE